MKKFNYENKTYLRKLDELGVGFYSKYIQTIRKYSKNKKIKFLEVGCGNGIVLKKLKNEGYSNLHGVDVSTLFVKTAKKKGIADIYKYDGINLPFNDSEFDIISSFNVLEHTTEPEKYLASQIKKLKQNGYLIVACPNFFTPILATNHRRIHGVKNRIINTFRIFYKFTVGGDNKFERIEPVMRRNFQYDDDSIVVTNPIDLRKILLINGCKLIYESGFINQDTKVSMFIDRISVLRFMMPSCFIVARKIEK